MNTSNVVLFRAQNTKNLANVPPLREQISVMPEFLGVVIDHILADFDYDANLTSSTAIAVRILTVMAENLTAALENNHV